ncbi:MAG: signal peptidase I [Myxococcales bacterium]|nr:signal peptidase I [Myxococcales bacterium]
MPTWLRWTLWIVGILGIVLGVFRYFFIDFHRVPDDVTDPRNWAMSPNLEPGDFVLVWRGGTPHVGDVVRCNDPTDPQRWLVSRIIGLPGDKIEIVDGVFKINNFRIGTAACSQNPRAVPYADTSEVTLTCLNEEHGGNKHDIAYLPTGYTPFAEAVVQGGKYFVMSDNRSSPWSQDSRTPEVGQLPMESCTQRLVVRLTSKNGWGDSARRMGWLF